MAGPQKSIFCSTFPENAGFKMPPGPQNYDYLHLPLEYGLCRTKMFAVSILFEVIFVLCIRRRYSRVRLVLVCIRGFGRLFALFSLLFP